jgi:hypothetical protein
MDKALKRKWVKALLSGKYEQGNCVLEHFGRYCCLGVLNEVAKLGENTEYAYLYEDAERKAGLNFSVQSQLAHLNDVGVPFDMIAGLIEEAL